MSATEIKWPGGEHEFRLGLGELRALQDHCKAGPERILARLRTGDWYVDDLIEPLRLGLMGAGMAKKDARDLVVPLIEQHALAEFKLAATLVMMHALLRPAVEAEDPEDAPGETMAGATPTTAPDVGVSPAYMETAP